MEQKNSLCEFYSNHGHFLLGGNINIGGPSRNCYLLIYFGFWTFCIGWDFMSKGKL
jgi:hypothetical protein